MSHEITTEQLKQFNQDLKKATSLIRTRACGH